MRGVNSALDVLAALAALTAVCAVALIPTGAHAADRDCSDFDNQADAQRYFLNKGDPNSDPDDLDSDGDGLACETLPCPCPVQRCKPIVNPYPNTRYAGSNLHHIRADGVPCRRARKVARRAHRKALRMALPDDGVREYDWRKWYVVGDIRGRTDHYRARRGEARVRWRF
jgi:hypothetical protein